MAVHRRGYHQYDGPRTSERFRFWILSRYAFRRVFRSRMLVVFYAFCFFPTVLALSAIYISHHVDLLLSLFPRAEIREGDLVVVDANFFILLMTVQATLSAFVTAFIGPGLVSPDLTNNALPLYFSRPFSRVEYVLGKFSVLFVALSGVTVLPMLLIFAVKSLLAGSGWLTSNIHLGFAVAVGCLVWVILISLIALACSAWLRWRPAAAGMIFALFFFPAGFGQAANQILRTGSGSLLNGTVVIGTIWNSLFFMHDPDGYDRAAAVLNPMGRSAAPISPLSAWMMAAVVCGVSIFLLSRKVRAHEVVS